MNLRVFALLPLAAAALAQTQPRYLDKETFFQMETITAPDIAPDGLVCENTKAFRPQFFGDRAVEKSRFNVATLEGASQHRLVADGEQSNIVALLVDAQVLQSQLGRNPLGSADADDADALTRQIFRFLNLRFCE